MSKLANIIKNRPNKQAKGFTKHYEQSKEKGKRFIENPAHPEFNSDLCTLMVRGTLDHLAKTKLHIKKIMKEHPTDKGYFKEMYILNESGKKLLASRKKHKERGFPFWEYMYKVNTL